MLKTEDDRQLVGGEEDKVETETEQTRDTMRSQESDRRLVAIGSQYSVEQSFVCRFVEALLLLMILVITGTAVKLFVGSD